MNKQQDMTTGVPWKQILLFAVPLFIGNVFQMLYNMVDAVVVGRFVGIQTLAAVGASGPSYMLIISLVNASVVMYLTLASGFWERI